MITAYFNEKWDLMNRSTDSEGRQMCHVRRVKDDGVCVWRLVRYPNGWRNVGQLIPGVAQNGFRPTPERHGKLLSNSRTDLTLRSFAETGHGMAYA